MAEQESRERHALYRLIALLATFTTASDVRQGIRERRAGKDPSEQSELGEALSSTAKAIEDLREVLTPLQASLVHKLKDEQHEVSDYFRDFSHLILLRRLVRLYKRLQQYMLSLYPAVSEEDVETCRLFAIEAEKQIELQVYEASDFLEYVQRCFLFLNRVDSRYLRSSYED